MPPALIKDLTLEYNKLRQGSITQELLEIAGGQARQRLRQEESGQMNKGKIVQVVGPVVDVAFPGETAAASTTR